MYGMYHRITPEFSAGKIGPKTIKVETLPLIMMAVDQDKSLKKLWERTDVREGTHQGYTYAVLDLSLFAKELPADLIELFKGSPEKGLELLERWLLDCKKRKMMGSTVKFRLSAIRQWLWANKARPNRDAWDEILEIKRKAFRTGKLPERIITREQLIEMMECHTNGVRDKWFITGLTSSGIRIGGFRGLRFKHIKDDLNRDLNSYMVEVPRELDKARRGYITFITPQARDILLTYKKERETAEEKVTPESLCMVRKGSRWGKNKGEPLKYSAVNAVFRRLFDRAGLSNLIYEKNNGRQKITRYDSRIHLFRKFFKTMCTRAGVDPIFSEKLSGRTLKRFGVESIYEQNARDPKFLREQYERAVPHLTLARDAEKVVRVYNRIEQLEAQLKEKNEKKWKELKEMTERIVKQRLEQIKNVQLDTNP